MSAAVAELVQGSDQLSFEVGGKRPTGSSIRIVGGRRDVEGQFAKGQKLRVEMVVEVRAIEFVDEVDEKTQQVVGSQRRHKASPVGPIRIVAAEDDE